jgi:hypothetical protein
VAVDAIGLLAAGEAGADPEAAAHVGECLRCQAEVAAFRRVLRIMHDMQGEVDRCGAGSPWPTRPTLAASRHLRAAYLGGITVGAAGVIAWLSRHRQIAG